MRNRLSDNPEARQKRQDEQIHAFLDLYKRRVSNENEDPMSGSGTLISRTNSLMNETPDRSSVLNECPASPTNMMMRRKMTDYSAKFIDKNTWKKGHYCNICKREVDVPGVNRHHCRMCANTVCGNCSCRKINSRRVCDLCFYRKEIGEQDTRFQQSLAQRQQILEEKTFEVEKLKTELVNKREMYCKYEDQIEKEQYMQTEAIEKQTKVKFNYLSALEKAKGISTRLSSAIEINKGLIGEKESRLRSLQTKIISLKVEVAQKSHKHKELMGQFDELIEKHAKLNETTEPGLSMSSSRVSVASKNFSLAVDEKDGKYYVSRRPVQI